MNNQDGLGKYYQISIFAKDGEAMPVEVVSYMLSIQDGRERLQFQLAYQCAPFLKRLRASCLTNIEKRDCPALDSILAGTDIKYRLLTADKGRYLLFLYRQRELWFCLDRAGVREFLARYGYLCQSLEAMLDRLSDRVSRYAFHGAGFPHEIGVFLNYPVDDVRCFIECRGKGGFMTGYWKVYHYPGRAQMIFQAYDKARTSAVNECLAGKKLKDIAR